MVNPLARVVMDNVSRKVKDDKNLKDEDRNLKKIENLSNKDKELIKEIINKSSGNVGNINSKDMNRKSMVTLNQVVNGIKEKR